MLFPFVKRGYIINIISNAFVQANFQFFIMVIVMIIVILSKENLIHIIENVIVIVLVFIFCFKMKKVRNVNFVHPQKNILKKTEMNV